MILAGSDNKLNRSTIDNIESYFLSFQNCGTKYIHFYIIMANHTPLPLKKYRNHKMQYNLKM